MKNFIPSQKLIGSKFRGRNNIGTDHSEWSDVQEVSNKQLYPMKCCSREDTSITQHNLQQFFQTLPCVLMPTLKPKGTAIELSNLSSPFLPCLVKPAERIS